MATGESYGTKLLRFWAPNGWTALWVLVFGLAPLFFFETFVHEGLHWLTAVAAGGDPTLIPFAHFNSNFGRNVNGATMDSPGFIAMPQIVCFLLLLGLIAVFIFSSPPWRWLRTLLTWWYLGLAIDILFNTVRGAFGASPPGTDWYKFGDEYGNGLATFLSWLILLAVLSQLVWIIWSRWHENRPPAQGFFAFRGVAIAYAVLSLIALVLSFAIQHPAIVRNWWFWAVWVFQLVSFMWYVLYLIWATREASA
jgi:hypothetical protein